MLYRTHAVFKHIIPTKHYRGKIMESLISILLIPVLLLIVAAVFFIIKWLYYDLTIGQWLDLWKEKKIKNKS